MLFKHLDNFYTAYLDNILIYLDNVLKHEYYVKQVLKRLRATGL